MQDVEEVAAVAPAQAVDGLDMVLASPLYSVASREGVGRVLLATTPYSVASKEGVGRVLLATTPLPLGATVLQDTALLSAPDGI